MMNTSIVLEITKLWLLNMLTNVAFPEETFHMITNYLLPQAGVETVKYGVFLIEK